MPIIVMAGKEQSGFITITTVCLAVIMSLVGCVSFGPSSANTPEEMFEALIQSPIPADVTNLEGVGDTWQGHSIYLRFQAPSAYIETYTTDGFETVPCEVILPYLQLPDSSYDIFHPSWGPESVTDGICYRSTGLVGETWIGHQYLLWDPKTETVYFYGIGN